jgi:hypothetical protein
MNNGISRSMTCIGERPSNKKISVPIYQNLDCMTRITTKTEQTSCEELKKIPKEKNTAGQGPTLAELGAGKKDAARAQRLAAVGSPSAIFPSGATDALPPLDLANRRPARGYTSRREGRWRDVPMRGLSR